MTGTSKSRRLFKMRGMGKATKGNVYPLWLLTKEHMGSIPTKAGLYTVIALSESFVVGSISAQMLQHSEKALR
jgi:hypothetical protein